MIKKIKVLILVVLLAILTSVLWINNSKKTIRAYTQKDVVFYGNDISKWQGQVNFNKMKTLSDFVIIRIGYGMSQDKNFVTYMDNALKSGLNVGVYIYSLAQSEFEAINEANWVVSTLENYGYDNAKLTFPIYLDYEENSIITSKTKKQNTQIINAFANVIFSEGFYAGVYMGASHFSKYVIADEIVCDVWLAQYFGSNNPSDFTKKLNNSHQKVKMWQFAAGPYSTSGGTVSSHVKYTGEQLGVSSLSIDENWCFIDYPTLIKTKGYNGFIKGQNSSVSSSSDSKNDIIGSSSNSSVDDKSESISSSNSSFNSQSSNEIVGSGQISGSESVNSSGVNMGADDKDFNKNFNSSGCTSNISSSSFIGVALLISCVVFKIIKKGKTTK